MKRLIAIIVFIHVFATAYSQHTYCNPLNLDYRYCLSMPSRREAADPTMVRFKNEYYLFASKSGGYWHSKNLLNWDLITTKDLPLEDYAPTTVVVDNEIYFMASGSHIKIYKTTDPKSGKWEVVNEDFPIGLTDPCLFFDDDRRLYLYYGCSNQDPLYAVELDLKNKLNPIGKPVATIYGNNKEHGWDNPGDYNENAVAAPWVEGSWMNKHHGKYYLQYATPGTQFKSYADVAYVSDMPLGPFKLQKNNPFSYKPEGFISGAGHSSTFCDLYGNYWHITTMTISKIHMFERRLGLFPSGFDKDGTLYTNTAFGDYPHYIPNKKFINAGDLFTGWMLLSYKKPVEVSSAIDSLPSTNAVDEDVRTYWSAKSGNKGEWLCVDLKKQCDVYALQINFADHNTTLLGRDHESAYQYLVQYSNDKTHWKTLINKSNNTEDHPHDYIELPKAINARYVKITNYHVPDGTFALSGFRVFGKGKGKLPGQVKNFTVERSGTDRKTAKISWDKVPNALGYNIRYGTARDKLYLNYQVYTNTSVFIHSLDKNTDYYFTIDPFNENGVTKGR